MPNAKPKQSCRVHVSLLFKKEIALLKPISFERAFPNCSADKVTVTNKGIRIAFERTRKVSGAKIFGKTRIDYIRWIILLLSCLEDNPSAPSVASISYSLNEATPKNLKIPEELQQTIIEYSGIHFPYTTIDKALKSDCSSEALKIAISYCWVASKAISQEERLKLLWGAFNALYRWYGKSQNLKNPREIAMLDATNKLFLSQNVLVKTIRQFDKALRDPIWKNLIRWKVITSSRSSSLYIQMKDKQDVHNAKCNRLMFLDKDTLIYMRDIGCGTVKGKQSLKSAIDTLLPHAKTDKVPLRRACLLACRYAYIFRCEGVHANKVYPVFNAKSESEKQFVNDLLELVIVDFSTWIASNNMTAKN